MTLAEVEARSIREFVERAAADGYLSGRVLDYGCGKQPYRDIVEAVGGDYQAYDSPEFPGNVSGKRYTPTMPHEFDATLCTQVIQYAPEPLRLLRHIAGQTRALVMTYPTHWPELRDEWWRFTKIGMERLLGEAGFTVVSHEPRAVVHDPWIETRPGARVTLQAELTIGYGVIAKA